MPRKKKLLELSSEDMAVIRRIAHTSRGNTDINHADVRDIEQQLAIYLIQKIPLYRKGRKTGWPGFRGMILRQKMLAIYRERTRPSARTYSSCLVLSLDEEFQGGFTETLEEVLTLKDCINQDGLLADGTEKAEIPDLELKIDMENFIAALPPKLRKVCIALQTQTISTTARSLRIHPSDIYRRMEKIRILMEEAGLRVYL